MAFKASTNIRLVDMEQIKDLPVYVNVENPGPNGPYFTAQTMEYLRGGLWEYFRDRKWDWQVDMGKKLLSGKVYVERTVFQAVINEFGNFPPPLQTPDPDAETRAAFVAECDAKSAELAAAYPEESESVLFDNEQIPIDRIILLNFRSDADILQKSRKEEESLTPFPPWVSFTTYAKDAEASQDGKWYASLRADNINNPPATSPEWWKRTRRRVSLDRQADKIAQARSALNYQAQFIFWGHPDFVPVFMIYGEKDLRSSSDNVEFATSIGYVTGDEKFPIVLNPSTGVEFFYSPGEQPTIHNETVNGYFLNDYDPPEELTNSWRVVRLGYRWTFVHAQNDYEFEL